MSGFEKEYQARNRLDSDRISEMDSAEILPPELRSKSNVNILNYLSIFIYFF